MSLADHNNVVEAFSGGVSLDVEIESALSGGKRTAQLPATSSFDHLIGAEQQGRGHREAEGLRGLRVDDELELCRLLDR